MTSVRMLEDFVAAAREAVERRKAVVAAADLESRAAARDRRPRFREALAAPGLSLIAEFKRRSPSAGEIRPGASVAEVVAAYESAGAAALSVLTEERHFHGSLDDLGAARAASRLPLLRKDFVVDRYQLHEAAAADADAVLLIVAALEDAELAELHREAAEAGLDCLVEVHDEAELGRALELGAGLIGINNRNLDDLSVDLGTTPRLVPSIPTGTTVVAESGIEGPEQLEELRGAGVDAVLIGEALMRADDPLAEVRRLLGSVREEG